jgi:hypothetical protein
MSYKTLWTETDSLNITPAFKILWFRVVFMKNKFWWSGFPVSFRQQFFNCSLIDLEEYTKWDKSPTNMSMKSVNFVCVDRSQLCSNFCGYFWKPVTNKHFCVLMDIQSKTLQRKNVFLCSWIKGEALITIWTVCQGIFFQLVLLHITY